MTAVLRYSNSTEIRNNQRISVMYVPRVTGGYGCATINAPLVGRFKRNPAIIMGMSGNSIISPSSTLAIQALGGVLLAHEVGHIFGFEHPVAPSQTVIDYPYDFLCELFSDDDSFSIEDDIRYPVFTNQFPRGINDNVIWDPVTGERYDHKDWQARTNLMAGGNYFLYFQPWKIHLFGYAYEPIYDQIIDCWFKFSGIPPPE